MKTEFEVLILKRRVDELEYILTQICIILHQTSELELPKPGAVHESEFYGDMEKQ